MGGDSSPSVPKAQKVGGFMAPLGGSIVAVSEIQGISWHISWYHLMVSDGIWYLGLGMPPFLFWLARKNVGKWLKFLPGPQDDNI